MKVPIVEETLLQDLREKWLSLIRLSALLSYMKMIRVAFGNWSHGTSKVVVFGLLTRGSTATMLEAESPLESMIHGSSITTSAASVQPNLFNLLLVTRQSSLILLGC
jgi:hypothetical protein